MLVFLVMDDSPLRVIGGWPNPALADLLEQPNASKLRSGAAGMFMRATNDR
jgi:hypothetical protein